MQSPNPTSSSLFDGIVLRQRVLLIIQVALAIPLGLLYLYHVGGVTPAFHSRAMRGAGIVALTRAMTVMWPYVLSFAATHRALYRRSLQFWIMTSTLILSTLGMAAAILRPAAMVSNAWPIWAFSLLEAATFLVAAVIIEAIADT